MINHMALFNHMTLAALAAQPTSVTPRESLFVNAKMNGKDVRIMVDTGATHNFVTKERAKDLWLNYVASDTMLKTSIALLTTVHGFTPKRFRKGADLYCGSTGLKQHANYIPALRDNLKTLDENLIALTFSQDGASRGNKADLL
ncbi:hypothetical protein H5410_015740 [Solanum commersonii]|uniref:Gag-pol polyprotein n=1 Tax=Solanum commersonii TaxID=4109 RepID=A0A9J5ZVB2_SOLCO|nr:hypothetical protein H5410_015740 [Solanum commersonii]